MATYRRAHIDTPDGSRIAVYRAGMRGPCVFAIGGLQGKTMEETQLGRVLGAASGYGAQVFLIDIPGSGKSYSLQPPTMDLWLADIAYAYRALGLGRCIWVGASMGGWLMLLLHRMNPEQFISMCALAPALDWTDESAAPLTPRSVVESMSRHHLVESLAIRAPLHIIHGKRDDVARPEVSERLAARLAPRATITLLEDADHRVAKLGPRPALDAFGTWLRAELDRVNHESSGG